MTKFVLHGGVTAEDCPTNRDFFKVMADALPENGLWAVCNFARETDDVQKEIFERDLKQLEVELAGKPIRSELASAETLPSLLEKCDVFYMTGGTTNKLHADLIAACPDFVERVRRVPMVAGSSAGCCVLCRDSVDEHAEPIERFGLIPYGAVVHYKAEEGYEHQNDLSKRKLPLLMLHERQFVVIEQDY